MWAEKGLNLDTALEYVTTAIELDPKNGAYIDTLAWICFKQESTPKLSSRSGTQTRSSRMIQP